MNLLMISGDRSMLQGKQGAFFYTLEALSREFDRVDVICPCGQDTRYKTQDTKFFENVFFHPSPRGLWYQPFWIVKKGKELIDRYHHSVMTVHEYPPFYNGIGARRLSKKTDVPHVLEVHHIVGYPVSASHSERIGKILSWCYLPSAIKQSAGCRTVSKGTAQTLIRWGAPVPKIKVVPSFYLDHALVEGLGDAPPQQFDVVFCGRLVANKGARQLLDAIAELPKATLLIIGDGPERPYLQERARDMKIEQRVEFRGWLPTQRDVLQAIRSAKMLVMNSTSEGGPRVPLEAMACGVPVIVTKVGVMPDVIEDGKNGLFTTGRSDDLAVQISRILNDHLLQARLGREAVKILDRFERYALIRRYADFLRLHARASVGA